MTPACCWPARSSPPAPLRSAATPNAPTASPGIVLCFDPVSEFERGDAFRHTYGVLTQLKSQLGRCGSLPHYVAVCITKFDEIRVLESAQKLKLVEYDPEPPEFPNVPDEYARGFSPGYAGYRGRITPNWCCRYSSRPSGKSGSGSS
jgi:hypothetical protein